jgi:1-aminocyclopropane-1-carboxylate deaminase
MNIPSLPDPQEPSLAEPLQTLPPEPLDWPGLAQKNISADVLRLDRLHPVISGNKWFKLKGYLREALQSPGQPVITFGGPWSNHLIAAACATRQQGLTSIGIVRGERPPVLSATLTAAADYGMQLEFISRSEYARKEEPDFLRQLTDRFPGAYIIPEGGAGPIGIKGSEDILRTGDTSQYTHILCAVGTGTTLMGLIRAAGPGQVVTGIPILKGFDEWTAIDPHNFLTPEQKAGARLLTGYHFGGYARHPPELLEFMNQWYRETGVPSDIVYTGKLFFALWDSVRLGLFPPGSRLLIIHSGGLQGNLSLPWGILGF